MTSTTARLAVAAFALALVAGACSDDDGQEADGGVAEDDAGVGGYGVAIAESLRAQPASPFDDEQAGCVGEGIAAALGEERLREVGTPEEVAALDGLDDLEPAEGDGEEIGRAIAGCDVRFSALLAATGAPLDDAAAACVDEALGEDELAVLFGQLVLADADAAAALDDGASAAVLAELVVSCPGLAGP